MDIPIVVAAYNRTAPLGRLLRSLAKAHYDSAVKLIVCIDGDGSSDVLKVAEHFDWVHGEKEIIVQKENIGLKQHILFCGDLSSQYDGVIVLEDDLYVSPWFYSFAQSTAQYYSESSGISGIALYSPHFNENARLPFYPLDDGHDVYFMQIACSWGQVWLKRQWEGFRLWYGENECVELNNDESLPWEIRQWPESSWKKYFIMYMLEKDKYFVYPRASFTTNFGDMGTHHHGTSLYQVPLKYNDNGNRFVSLDESLIKYDVFFEIIPESLYRMSPNLPSDRFIVDLYGIKEAHCFTEEFVITSKVCKEYIISYGRHLLPVEYNVIDAIPGCDLFWTTPDKICKIKKDDFRKFIYERCATIEEQKYYYPLTDFHYFKKHIGG